MHSLIKNLKTKNRQMSTKFFTNEEQNSVFRKFCGILEHMKDLFAFHAVVGYFRSSGYFALRPHLENVKDIKILVGINVDQMFAQAQKKGLLYNGDEEKTKEEFFEWFIKDLKEAKYSKEVEDGILQFINDIVDERIEVRAHKSASIHAKFYLFLPEIHSQHSDGWVIMGSSNLTEAGLGIKKAPNYELNIALKDFDDVNFTKEEFKKLWGQSITILPADILKYKEKTHIGQIFTPFEIYIKLLIEYFGNNINYDPDTIGDLPKAYKKLSYQVDAVNQGFQMLLDHNGFFLADVVGLGKTVVAAIIANRFRFTNGPINTKILVVHPPALEKNWKTTFKYFKIDKYAQFVSTGRLERVANGNDLNYWHKEDYDLIIVDEAHKYRTSATQGFDLLQRICKAPRNGTGRIEGKKKKVMLISATPLNNSPQDLYNQLLLFQDARKSTLPITNLQSFFAPIIQEYKDVMRSNEPKVETIRVLYEKIREKIISPITIRRTRRDIRNYPKYLSDLKDQNIIFPEIAPLNTVNYSLNSKLSKLFYQTIFYLTDEDKIHYFRYQAIRFLKEELREQHYEKAELVSKSLAGIMKTLMVKRLESSFYAFRKSLHNLLTSTERMIKMLEGNRVLIAPDLNINQLIDKGYSFEDIEKLIEELSIEKPRNNIFTAEDFEPTYLEGLKKDEALLNELIDKWKNVEEDPKIEELFKAMDNDLLNTGKNPSGLLIIFTESKDTAKYLADKLKVRSKKEILQVSSENRKKIFEVIQANFDANYLGDKKDDYQILITTDVLAEGINLHRANVLINYDTPWNATRLMQRIGRINRIGSPAGIVYNYIFYPSQQGDEEIKLYKNALIKLQGFHSAFGEDSQVFTQEEMVEQFELFKEGMKDEDDKRLSYLKYIREYKDTNPQQFKRIKNFPLKARTARKNANALIETAKNSTLVFLKSPYKTDFYSVDKDNNVTPLNFLEAAERFKAKPDEKEYGVPESHFTQVQHALNEFEQEYLNITTETIAATERTDPSSAQAKRFLRDINTEPQNQELKRSCLGLISLIDKGTFTALPKNIKAISTKLEKKTITYGEAIQMVINIDKKYNENGIVEDNNLSNVKIDLNLAPEIVITETFID